MRKPLLGICYGLQSLNVWRTGTLVQHIESDVVHTRPKGAAKSQQIVHEAIVEPASELGRIVASALKDEGQTVEVNSSHHQAVDVAGDGLSIVARSKDDGVIEALESMADDHWVMGVQWHPERMTDAVSKALFAELVKQARAWHEAMARSKGDFESLSERTPRIKIYVCQSRCFRKSSIDHGRVTRNRRRVCTDVPRGWRKSSFQLSEGRRRCRKTCVRMRRGRNLCGAGRSRWFGGGAKTRVRRGRRSLGASTSWW